MKCQCCDCILSDYESTLKRVDNGEYVDICLPCLDGLGIETVGRKDLEPYTEMEHEDFFDQEPEDD